MSKLKATPVVIVSAILALIGIAVWIFQITQGLAVTGMNNGNSWGLYITCFMFFVGLSAGGLIVASSASVFGIKEYKKVAKPAVILSTVCIVAAAAFVIVDLGGPVRVFNLIIHAQFTSPLLWDVIVITLYLAINIVYLVFMAKADKDGESERNERALRITSRFALPVAILVHSVTAWIFGLEIAKAGWYSAIMAPLFVSSAMDSGLALLIITLVILNVTKVFKTEGKLLASLAGLLAVCVAVDGFMVASELLTMAYPAAPDESALLAVMTSGSTAPFFWAEIVLGLIVPFFLLVFTKLRQKTTVVVVASALVVLGVFCKRAWLLLTSFANFNVAGAPGVTYGRGSLDGSDIWTLTGSYVPTWVELVIVLGVISLAVLLFAILAQRLLGGGQAAKQTESAQTVADKTAVVEPEPVKA
jgi:molybdopterin-containing oxidoreductase family membrane subunit